MFRHDACTRKPLRDVRFEKLPFAEYSVAARRRAVRERGTLFEEIVWDDLHLRASGATVDKPHTACPPELAPRAEEENPRQQVCRWS